MAGKIPIYEAQVRQAAIPDIGSPGYLNIQDFARSSDGAMLKDVGQELAGIGKSLGAEVIERAKEKTATDLLASNVETEGELIAFDSDFRKNNKGISARYADVAYSNFIDDLMASQKEKFKDNPYALQGLARMEAAMRPRFMARAVAYRDEQEQEYQQDQLRSYHQQTADKWADPGISLPEKQQALAGLETSLRYFAGQRYAFLDDGNKAWAGGKNIDADLSNIRQNLMLGHAQGLLESGRHAEAGQFVRAHEQQLGPMVLGIKRQITNAANHAAAKKAIDNRNDNINLAFQHFADQNPEEVAKILSTPEGMKQFSLDADGVNAVCTQIRLRHNSFTARDENIRQEVEKSRLEEFLGLAMGKNGQEADPVAASKMVMSSLWDGKTQADLLNAVEKQRINTKDDHIAVYGMARKVVSGEMAFTENEFLRTVATGKSTIATQELLQNIQKQIQGPDGRNAQKAYQSLENMMGVNVFLEGSPEQAAAQLNAMKDLYHLIAKTSNDVDAYSIFYPANADTVSSIAKRHKLNMAEQATAMMNWVNTDEAKKILLPGKVDHLRQPGEGIDAYLNRAGN